MPKTAVKRSTSSPTMVSSSPEKPLKSAKIEPSALKASGAVKKEIPCEDLVIFLEQSQPEPEIDIQPQTAPPPPVNIPFLLDPDMNAFIRIHKDPSGDSVVCISRKVSGSLVKVAALDLDQLERLTKIADSLKGTFDRLINGHDVSASFHLGHYLFASVNYPFKCLHIRNFYRKSSDPNGRFFPGAGVHLNATQVESLYGWLQDVERHVPDFKYYIGCRYQQSLDHSNSCPICNPGISLESSKHD